MKPSYRETLIPSFYYRWMQILGILPYTIPPNSTFSLRNPLLKLWSLLMFSIFIFLLRANVLFMYNAHMVDLANLELFSIIQFVFVNMLYIHGGMVTLLCIVQMSQLHTLSRLACSVVSKIICIKDHIWIFITIWIWVFVSANVLAMMTPYFDPRLRGKDWDKPVFRVLHEAADQYSPYIQIAAIVFQGVVLGSNCIVPYGALFGLVYYLGKGFDTIRKKLDSLCYAELKSDEVVRELRMLQKLYGHLVYCVEEVDDLFGPLVLLRCFLLFMTWIAFIGELLNVERSAVNWMMCMVGGIGFLQFVLDLTALILFSDRAKSVKKATRRVLALSPEARVEQAAKEFFKCCRDEDGAISAMGFFHVNRGYVTVILGVIGMYFLLIYQARDQKLDLLLMREALAACVNSSKL